MKNYLISTLFVFELALTGCAGTYQLNPKGKDMPLDKSQAFELGYKKALLENAQTWEDRGMNKAKKALSNYAEEIKAFEAGKSARSKGYLDETRAIVIKNSDGSVTIKTIGGNLKKSLNANQIIDYYKDNKDMFPVATSSVTNNPYKIFDNTKPLLLNESFKLSSEKYIDEAKGRIADNRALLKEGMITLENNELSKGIIDLYGLNCSNNKTTYQCSFKNEKLKKSFCKETGVCK
ncbi:MAG TPA: hypothetical protein EYG73_03100 [Arcobacter sp.]|nr:hypothetical protein [Arcobacter sp.]